MPAPDEKNDTYGEWGFWKRFTRRKWYLYPFRPLDKRLQLNIAVLLTVIGAVNAFYFSILFYFYSQESFYRLARWIPDYVPPEELIADQVSLWLKTLLFVGTFEIVLILLLGLFFSHRIAGPLYAMGLKMKELARGGTPGPVALRRNDLLNTFSDQVNTALAYLEKQRHELDAIAQEMDKGNMEEAKSRLKEITGPEPKPESASPDN